MSQATAPAIDRDDFSTESDFVDSFVGKLSKGRTSFGKVEITKEWDHRAGVVDVLARHRRKTLVAFEAKLNNWKRAFHQAYRSTAYANKSYVIVPAHVAARALRNRDEFELRGGTVFIRWKIRGGAHRGLRTGRTTDLAAGASARAFRFAKR